MQGIDLEVPPAGSSSSLYAVIGRLPADTGGSPEAGMAASYSAGGAGYAGAGALGLSLIRDSATAFRLQILDSGGSVASTIMALDGQPTGIRWRIDGEAARWRVTLTGARFASAPEGVGLSENSATAEGRFTHFRQSGVSVGGGTVSRVAVGAYNLTTGANARATIGKIAVQAPGTLGTTLDRAVAYFGADGAKEGFVDAGPLGWLFADRFPWVFSYELDEWRSGGGQGAGGWLYAYGGDFSETAWFWDHSLQNWWFAVRDWYPWVYVDGDDWLNLQAAGD